VTGRRLGKRKTKEVFERNPVVDLSFQLGVGIDLEPLLEQEAFHEDQGRPCLVAIGTLADGIIFHE